jgi:hypothetical protein
MVSAGFLYFLHRNSLKDVSLKLVEVILRRGVREEEERR